MDTTIATSLYKICSPNTPSGRIGYKCNICQKVLYSKDTLRHHLQRHVEGHKPLQQQSKDSQLKDCQPMYPTPRLLQSTYETVENLDSTLELESQENHKIGFMLDVYNAMVE